MLCINVTPCDYYEGQTVADVGVGTLLSTGDPVTPAAPRRSEAVRKLAEGDSDVARRSAADRIVSPVIPQLSPRRKRRRTSSEGRVESGDGGIKRANIGGAKVLSGDVGTEKAAAPEVVLMSFDQDVIRS